MKIHKLWTDWRVPQEISCTECNGTNSAKYEFTTEEGAHEYACRSCGAVMSLTASELNSLYFASLDTELAEIA